MPLALIDVSKSTYQVSATITDSQSLVANASVTGSILRLTGPGYSQLGTLISKSPATADAQTITALIQFSGPFPACSTAQTYLVSTVSNTVRDTAGNFSVTVSEVPICTDTSTTTDANPPSVSTTNFTPISAQQNSYTISITYSDDVAINAATIGTGDVMVTGPGGFSQSPALASVSSSANTSPITATYTLQGPFDSSSNGSYTVMVPAGSIADTNGNLNAATNVGLIIVNVPATDTTAPTANATSFPGITTAATFYDFSVTYQDNEAVDVSSITSASASAFLSGSAQSLPVQLLSITPNTDSQTATAQYRTTHNFTDADNGDLIISVNSGSVRDTSGNLIAAAEVGRANVNVPTSPTDTASPVVQTNTFTGIANSTNGYEFQITYTDDTAIDVSTLNLSGVSMTLNGASIPLSVVSTSPTIDAPSVTVTYRANYNFTSTDAGTAIIAVGAGSVRDTSNKPNIATTVGSVPVTITDDGIVQGDVSIDFTTVGSFPPGWTTTNANTNLTSSGLEIEPSGTLNQNRWINQVESPQFIPENGDVAIIEWYGNREQVAVGIDAAPSSGIDFGTADALLWFGGGDLSDGNAAFDTGATTSSLTNGLNRLTVEFGNAEMTVITEHEVSPGVFVESKRVTQPIPAGWKTSTGATFIAAATDEVQSPLAQVTLVSTLLTKAAPLPNGVILQRTIPAAYQGANSSNLRMGDWNTLNFSAMSPALMSLGLSVWREAGDEANYWNENGLYQDLAGRVPTGQWGTPNGLPPWIAYLDGIQSATPNNRRLLMDAAGSTQYIYTVNVTTSTPAQEVQKVQNLRAIHGSRLTTVVFGNEIFFGIVNYTGIGNPGDPQYLRGHTSSYAYSEDIRDNWITPFRNAFGNSIKLGVPIIPTNSVDDFSRENSWSKAVIDTGLVNLIDLIDIHPYFIQGPLNLNLGDQGNEAKMGDAARLAHRLLEAEIRKASISIFGDNMEIIVTEWTTCLEDQTFGNGVVMLGQTWGHSLMQCQGALLMLADPRITVATIHSLLENAQWAMMYPPDGTGIDAAKRGIDPQPFTSGYGTPFTPTLSGFALGNQNVALKGGGTGQLLYKEEGYIAWRCINTGTGHDMIALVNSNEVPKTFVAPVDRAWTYQRWTNNGWFEVRNVTSVPNPATGSLGAGAALTIPAFSQVIFNGSTQNGNPINFGPTATIGTITTTPLSTNAGPTASVGTITATPI